jgi:superfamily II DNA/RNA helicase
MGHFQHRYRQRNNSRYPRRGGYGSRGRKIRTFDPRAVIAALKESADTFSPVSQNGESVMGKITSSDSEFLKIKNKFSDFRLDRRLAENIADCGYSTPTPIQDKAIPEILSGRDVVGVANTGTGKTAAFLIPLINKIVRNRNSRVLIIAPTRELAVQIDQELQNMSAGMGIYSAICIGGVSIRNQIHKLHRRPHFVIGTPGRLLDLENQRKIGFGRFDSIVLDEVDRMLDMGFINDMEKIISKLPRERQSLFFSATLDGKVGSVMGKFITNPVMISVKTADASTNVYQDVVELKGRNKADVLCELLDKKEVAKSLIFMRTKRSADKLHRCLAKIGFQTAVLHGNKTQNQRQRSLEEFRLDRVNILIATDVASRGIDVDDITHVINYDLPESYKAYIHRIGRTGRADKKGIALTFVG